MNTVPPGKDGDPVPTGTLVFRIAENTEPSPVAIETGKASPMMFTLTSADKNSRGQRLSIWVEELTIADQAWGFLQRKPRQAFALCLSVDEICKIPAPAGQTPLRVEWEQAVSQDETGAEVPDIRAGATGHCGIAGLNQGTDTRNDKNKRKELRLALADKARISPVPVPHDFPEDHLRIAAFFIFKNHGPVEGPAEVHWIEAVRQFRRAVVRGREE